MRAHGGGIAALLYEKLGELETASGKSFCLGRPTVRRTQDIGKLAQHADTGARGRNDRIKTRKGIHEPQTERAGRRSITAVPGRLAATGLRVRNDDFAPRALEQLRSRKSGLGPEEIDEAGREQTNAAPAHGAGVPTAGTAVASTRVSHGIRRSRHFS